MASKKPSGNVTSGNTSPEYLTKVLGGLPAEKSIKEINSANRPSSRPNVPKHSK